MYAGRKLDNYMSKRQKSWARVARERLMSELGNECSYCGSTVELEFDCIIPRGRDHHTYSTDHRMCFYHREHAAGNIQILCRVCNAKKGNYQDMKAKHPNPEQICDDCPF